MNFVRFLLVTTLFVVGGCQTTPPLESTPKLSVTKASALPVPQRGDLLAADRPYLIGSFDKLRIDVFGVDELTSEVQADASGRISVPLIGVIEAAGKTPAELADEITMRLERYVKDPQVTVNLEETVSQVITVDGEVAKPGLYPVVGGMTLIRAIATAEGTSDLAQLDDVVVFRTVGGQRYAALYNLTAIRRGIYEDPELYPNDIVTVGQSAKQRLFRDALAVSPAILAPLVLLIR